MSALPKEAVGAILAAIIAAVVAFYSLIISKEQTVSNFRQHWIDALREDIAALISSVAGVHGTSIAKRKADKELWDEVKQDLTRLRELTARIRLRLNPQENRGKEKEATVAVLKALKDLEGVFYSIDPQFHMLEPLMAMLLGNAQVILKENWKRVRGGEPIYRVTKWVTLLVGALLISVGIYKLRLYLRS